MLEKIYQLEIDTNLLCFCLLL